MEGRGQLPILAYCRLVESFTDYKKVNAWLSNCFSLSLQNAYRAVCTCNRLLLNSKMKSQKSSANSNANSDKVGESKYDSVWITVQVFALLVQP